MDSAQKLITRFLFGVLILLSAAIQVQAEGIRLVHVEDALVRIELPTHHGDVTVVAGGCFTTDFRQAEVVYQGPANGNVISLDRFAKSGRDRLFDRFCLLSPDGNPIGSGRYATEVVNLNSPGRAAIWPDEIKGVQCVVDFDDVAKLGAAHVTVNVSIISLLKGPADSESTDGPLMYDVDGKRYEFRATQVAQLDQKVTAATGRGMNVIAILLCSGGSRRGSRPTLIHPDADLSAGKVFAVNLSDAEAERQYRAVIGFLGRRYSRPDQKYGTVGGYIVGNEVQSHGAWHNLGRQDASVVIREYSDQLRLTYFALRKEVANPKVFVSFDHHWTSQQGNDKKWALPGRRFLDSMAAALRDSGDFPWHIAWHPYPEDLFDPAFWNDSQATFSFETSKITFKNIEVLVEYLHRAELKYEGQRRRVILSEQGFHAGDSEDAEMVQAAAFAASYIRINAIQGIDAYILHRHVDHPREGGLKLGLWTEKNGRPQRKRPIYKMFQAAGTAAQTDTFRLALPIVGLASWDAMSPKTAIDGAETAVGK